MTRPLPDLRLGDDGGGITPLAAVTMAVLIGMAGLVIDIGVWYVQRRNLQGATDAAALAAANRPAQATAIAQDLLTRNGFTAAALVSAEAGYYCPDKTLAPAARFSLSPCATGAIVPAAPNAVRIRAKATGAPILSRALDRNQPSAGIRTVAIATRIDEAGLEVASGLVSADLPTSNAVLQSLLGGSGLSLSAVQFDGLINTDVDALTFFDALAVKAGVSAGTYDQVLNSQVQVADIFQAGIDALNKQNANQDVTAAISGMQALKAKLVGSPTVTLGKLFDLGVWRNEPVGASGTPAALKAGLNVYQLADFSLQLANGSHTATVPTSTLGVPGLLGVTLQSSVIEPPQRAYFTFGPAGLSVHTAQVRVKLSLQAAGGLIDFPIYVEVANGDATLTALTCGADPAYDATATVQANSGLATLYLGAVPDNLMTNFSTPVAYTSVTPVPILSVPVPILGLVQVNVKSKATAGGEQPHDLTFTQAPASGVPAGATLTTQGYIERPAYNGGPPSTPGWPAEVVSTGVLGGFSKGLWTNLTLTACVLGCSQVIGVPALLTTTLNTVLQPLLNGLDPLIDGTLRSLGVKIGRALVKVSGVRCGVPVLVT